MISKKTELTLAFTETWQLEPGKIDCTFGKEDKNIYVMMS